MAHFYEIIFLHHYMDITVPFTDAFMFCKIEHLN